jgi:hypothetical protein
MADFKTESQKFLSRSDWTLTASGGAYMKLRQNKKQRTAEYRITNIEFRRLGSLRSVIFIK